MTSIGDRTPGPSMLSFSMGSHGRRLSPPARWAARDCGSPPPNALTCAIQVSESRPLPLAGQLETNRLPSYHEEPHAYAQSVIDLVSACPTRVVIPSMDGSIAALRPWRSCFEQHGVGLALASEQALDAANDKNHTLALAAELGIPCPRTIRIECAEDTRAALSEVGYPAVIKPTQSWVTNTECATRVVSRAVRN